MKTAPQFPTPKAAKGQCSTLMGKAACNEGTAFRDQSIGSTCCGEHISKKVTPTKQQPLFADHECVWLEKWTHKPWTVSNFRLHDLGCTHLQTLFGPTPSSDTFGCDTTMPELKELARPAAMGDVT
jgi:hypothetical protein